MNRYRALRAWWRELIEPADDRDDYRVAQMALVRAGMSPEVSRDELDEYLDQIRAARSSRRSVMSAGFVAGMGVVLFGLALFSIGIAGMGLVEMAIRPGLPAAPLAAGDMAGDLPGRGAGGVSSSPAAGPIAVGLLLAVALGAFGAVLGLLDRARFERQRAPYTFARRRRRRLANTQAEILVWVALLAPVIVALAGTLSESSAVPVLFLLALGLVLFRSLWFSTYRPVLRAVSPYNAAGLASQILNTEATIIERQEEHFYGKGAWRRWVQQFYRRYDWGR